MELLVAVAVGLNPYAGAVVLAALAAFTGRVPMSETGAIVPSVAWGVAAVLYGAAMPVDFVLGKFARLAPRLRSISHMVAPLTAAFGAVAVQQSDLPVPLVAAGAALIAWGINTAVTANAARASRSPDYAGLGHVPVLMSAAVGAACVTPLGLALPALGYGSAGLSLLMLGLAELDRRSPRPAATRRPARAARAATPPAPETVATSSAPLGAAPTAPVVFPALRNVGRASGRALARAYAGAR